MSTVYKIFLGATPENDGTFIVWISGEPSGVSPNYYFYTTDPHDICKIHKLFCEMFGGRYTRVNLMKFKHEGYSLKQTFKNAAQNLGEDDYILVDCSWYSTYKVQTIKEIPARKKKILVRNKNITPAFPRQVDIKRIIV